jgi:hypothetical protein
MTARAWNGWRQQLILSSTPWRLFVIGASLSALPRMVPMTGLIQLPIKSNNRSGEATLRIGVASDGTAGASKSAGNAPLVGAPGPAVLRRPHRKSDGLLVLTRVPDEDIVIRVPGMRTPIVIRLMRIQTAQKVRLGFKVSPDVAVNRREVDELKFPNDPAPVIKSEVA